MLKSMLVHADVSAHSQQRIDDALAIARRHGGHLTALFNLPLQRFISTDPFGGAFLAAEALATAQADLLVGQTALAERLGRDDVPWDIVASEGDLAASLAASAALSDLVVVGMSPAQNSKFDAYPMLAGDLALAARVPVLALPDDGPGFDLEGPAVIAWNGSAEAATAVRQATPLLLGRSVTLLRVGESGGQFADMAALSYLSRHGVHTEARTETRGVETVEEAIERVAGEMGAALIVMGAFGHSRFRQTLFGGVTRYMLDSARVPLLLGH
jgi:nucleotide-binding universal stress UspA family protein